MRTVRICAAWAVVLAALAAMPAYGQSSLGSVRGTVRDQAEAAIPKAAVTLTNTATLVALKEVTSEVGAYVFPAVVPGPYRIEVEAAGMAKFEGTLTVQVQQSTVVDVTLKVGQTATQVTVVADVAPVVITDRPTLGHVVEREKIDQLPINGRNLVNLVITVPGMEPGQSRAYGVRQGAHDYILDGASLVDALDGEGTLFRPPGLDTIQEFTVMVNAVSAKYPRMTNVVMSSRSGTNSLHGSAFETNRNNSFGKARRRQDTYSKAPPYVRNEYGASVGGPVWLPGIYNGKQRTFWFVAYEAMKLRQSLTGLYRVPTQAMRQGDFSGLVNAQGQRYTIYDPWTTNSSTWSRLPFTYQGRTNVIDPARMSPLAKYISASCPCRPTT